MKGNERRYERSLISIMKGRRINERFLMKGFMFMIMKGSMKGFFCSDVIRENESWNDDNER